MSTINSQKVLAFLKNNYGTELTKQDIAVGAGVSLSSVTGSINGLVKKGYVTERMETVEVEPATETRKAKTKTIRYELLTEEGLAYDPVAEEAAKAAEKEAKRAEREAAKHA